MPSSPTASPSLPHLLSLALRPLPLAPLQHVLALFLYGIGKRHPGLYERLGCHANKRFGIDPTDLPFAFVLEPKLIRPEATAVRCLPSRLDASIRGPLSALVGMAEGRLDGDALFFSRQLDIEGDIEAVLALRNAVDDAGLNLANEFLAGLGLPGRGIAKLLSRHQFATGTAGAGSWS